MPSPDLIACPPTEFFTVRNAYANKDFRLGYLRWPALGDRRGVVVAVHGLTRQKRDFDYIARFLSVAGYEVYCVDAPGRGDSQWLDEAQDYSLLVYADIFTAFLTQTGLTGVHWLGTSMGGLLAMVMAWKGQGAFFRTLTLNDITPKPNADALKRISGYLSETHPVFASPEQYEAVQRQNLPLGPVPDDVWHHYAGHQLIKTGDHYTFHFDPKLARRATVDLVGEVDLSPAFEFITCPVALIAGSVSDLCTAQEISDMQRLVPRLRLHVVPGAGHVPALADDATQQFILEHIRAAV
ncbi:MAG TPA: alpha/beta hydrolase [Patescibacteria group bacterium]|nr:alpha/beta hydrolase [Patescibacteria group bacterium]